MAARKNRPQHTDRCREKIKTTQLINRLQNHVDGKVNLDNSQIKAIEILLKKSLADLKQIEISGDQDKPLHHTFTWQA